MKLELGGGSCPREGFLNLDRCPGPRVNLVFDLDSVHAGEMLPVPAGSVTEVYASHVLEHVLEPFSVLLDLARACAPGARVEARVPHWLAPMASCPGHRCVLSPDQVSLWMSDPAWEEKPRRLTLTATEHLPSSHFSHLCYLYPLWTRDDVLRFAPGACHEVRFVFEVHP